LLTGKRAFEGETITETIAAVLKSEPEWEKLPSGTPWRIKELLEDCLQKNSHDRPHDISHAWLQVKKALREPVTSLPTGEGSAAPGLWKQATPWASAAVIAVAVAVVLWSLTRSGPQPLSRLMITTPPTAPLADSSGVDAVISPDGRQLVYPSNVGGTLRLYLRSMDDLTVTLIAGTEGQLIGDPFFSPDGKLLAFFSGGKLKKASLVGGPPTTICDAAGPGLSGSWGLDDTIVFSSSAEMGIGLYRVSASGGEPEVLASPDPEKRELAYRFPQILPGGTAVLFTILGGEGPQIAVLSLDSGEQSPLIERGRQARYVPTEYLVYETTGTGALTTGTLMAVSFDVESRQVTGDPVPILEGVRSYGYTLAGLDFSFSDEGTLVYVPVEEKPEYSVVWVDREGIEQLMTQEKRSYATPRISPDGGRVAFTIFAEDGQNVWIYDLEEDSFSRFTLVGSNGSPSWSPDGRWIVFQSTTAGLRSLYRQPSDGTGSPEQLTVGTGSAGQPNSWSSNGVLAFQTLGANSWDIETLSMAGSGERRPLIASPNLECCAMFSPMGRWLAYVSNETGQLHVYVSSFEKPTERWLVSGEEGGSQPLWSPDGTELFYRSGNKVMVVPVKTNPTFDPGKPRILFQGSYRSSTLSTGYQYYDISPDGQRFLMIKETGGKQINVVLNWFEELKRLVPTN